MARGADARLTTRLATGTRGLLAAGFVDRLLGFRDGADTIAAPGMDLRTVCGQ